MAYSYKGAISFGLIYIPITLHTTIKNNDITFNLLDKKSKSRILYKKTCVNCNSKEVDPKSIVKGFEYEEGKYVIFTDDDFEKIKSKKDKVISIISFCDINQIDPLYYDKAYYVIPSGANKAFLLLTQALEEENKVAIAKCVMGNKENLIVIRVKDKQMLLNTLFFEEEVQPNPLPSYDEKISKQEITMAKTLITSMSYSFNIKDYKDEYKIKLEKAIKAKINGKEITKIRERKDESVDNIMDALKKSLSLYDKKTSKKKGNRNDK